jgi:ribosomal protein S18 acetylase RimI-like enzyme
MKPHVANRQIQIMLATTDDELLQILKLQQQNLPQNISKAEAVEQGFVTVVHSFEVLKSMNEQHPHVIAKQNGEVVGYALVMTREFKNEIPVLVPMFEMIGQLAVDERKLADETYVVMGQICIAKSFRGAGIFDALYSFMRDSLHEMYRYCVTEVAARNGRSVRAHRRVGFATERVYTAPDGEQWELMVWKWQHDG